MEAIVQRVSRASVTVAGEEVASIGRGLLVLVGVAREDTEADADALAGRLARLRVFPDAEGRMNLSAADAGAELLVVPNFTLVADTRRGNRPSFAGAADPARAEELYERVRAALGAPGGAFGAHMDVALVNDGPVTLALGTSG